jgi:hypothetical protein
MPGTDISVSVHGPRAETQRRGVRACVCMGVFVCVCILSFELFYARQTQAHRPGLDSYNTVLLECMEAPCVVGVSRQGLSPYEAVVVSTTESPVHSDQPTTTQHHCTFGGTKFSTCDQ